MNDIAGKEFRVGDTIAYPNRMGSSMWLCLGLVTEVDEEQNCLWVRIIKDADNPPEFTVGDRSYPIQRIDRAVIVKRW